MRDVGEGARHHASRADDRSGHASRPRGDAGRLERMGRTTDDRTRRTPGDYGRAGRSDQRVDQRGRSPPTADGIKLHGVLRSRDRDARGRRRDRRRDARVVDRIGGLRELPAPTAGNHGLREVHRFKNHGTLWGRQSVTFDTIAWFADKTVDTPNGSAHADRSPLRVVTHADRERWTTWTRDTPADRQWYSRRRTTFCHRLNDSEDGLAQRLLDWRLESRTLEDHGLAAQAGSYDDFRGHGRPTKTKPRAAAPGRTNPRYISGWHVERRRVAWPSDGDEHGRDSANWIADAPAHYAETTGLKAGWYAVVRSKVVGSRGRRQSAAAAIGPELATRSLVSKRLHVIGERQQSRTGPPGPMS